MLCETLRYRLHRPDVLREGDISKKKVIMLAVDMNTTLVPNVEFTKLASNERVERIARALEINGMKVLIADKFELVTNGSGLTHWAMIIFLRGLCKNKGYNLC